MLYKRVVSAREQGSKLEGEATRIVSLPRIPPSRSQLERNAGTSRR